MPRRSRTLPFILALAAALLALPAATAGADTPTKRLTYRDGHENRYRLAGTWLHRLDPQGEGVKRRWYRSSSRRGWSRVQVPHAWNVGDHSPASMAGGIGWYRKDFTLPRGGARYAWIVRFLSVNYRTRVWLNGRSLGRQHAGAYLPFEYVLRNLKRRGTNRLVVRVDSRRHPTDFPPLSFRDDGSPLGGWWNYGGILRDVELRRVDRVDVEQVTVAPQLPCRSCAATVRFRAVLRNLTGRRERVAVTGRFGTRRVRLGTASVAPRGKAVVGASLRVRRPKLWSPARPTLYTARVEATIGGRKIGGHRLHSGVRKIAVRRGRLELNDRPVSIRGVGLHEDSLDKGFAIGSAERRRLIKDTQDLGGTLIRAHYPLHPEMYELADRTGMLAWAEVPVYSIRTTYLALPSTRRRAVDAVGEMIETHRNHPSIAIWSISNELSSQPGPVQGDYIERAKKRADELDGDRPVGLAFAGYPGSGCQPRYGPLDVLGVNEYFGWYTGPGGQIADRELLPGYLDFLRQCYSKQALMISEFGVEANRHGQVEEKGSFEFQQDWIRFQLAVFATKPWLSGAVYWALKEFRVRPNWDGGNPRPNSPIHEKGVVRFDGSRKPAFADLAAGFRATQQYDLPRTSAAPDPAR